MIQGVSFAKGVRSPFFLFFWSLSDLGMLQRPLTLILLKKHRDANGRRIVIQTSGVYIQLSAKTRAYFGKNIAIEMGGISRYFSTVSGSGVDLILLSDLFARLLLPDSFCAIAANGILSWQVLSPHGSRPNNKNRGER